MVETRCERAKRITRQIKEEGGLKQYLENQKNPSKEEKSDS